MYESKNVELSIYTVVPHYVWILTATVHYGCSLISSDSKTVQDQMKIKGWTVMVNNIINHNNMNYSSWQTS